MSEGWAAANQGLMAWMSVRIRREDACPGLPVWSERDQLAGWTVEGKDGSVLVHAPTEGDGHLHGMDSGDWEVRVVQDGALVDSGWDFLRRLVARKVALHEGIVNTCKVRLTPFLGDVYRVAHRLGELGFLPGWTVRFRRLDG